MAERRMFAKTIIDSDAFLEMPATSQLLYFHLGLRADDEGFVNQPKSIMRTVGCKEDDMRVLISKNFIIPFESGVVVIKHWRIHNWIRKERIQETKYMDERSRLAVKENGAYTLDVRHLSDTCQTDVSQVSAESSIDKISIDESNTYDRFDEFWSSYPRKLNKTNARKAWNKLKLDDTLFDTIMKALAEQKKSLSWTKDGGQFIPHPTTWINGKRWEDEIGSTTRTTRKDPRSLGSNQRKYTDEELKGIGKDLLDEQIQRTQDHV
jgi:hypothetical protein